MSASIGSRPVTRRRFLRDTGLSLGAAALASIPGTALAGKSMRKVYRLSNRGRVSCNACRAHDANRFYFNRPSAEGDRAHAGCTCKVLKQWIPKATHEAYFGHGHEKRKVFDLRSQEEEA